MNQKPKAALDTLKKSTELGEKAINTLEEYVNEMENRLQKQPIKSAKNLDKEQEEMISKIEEFVPKTVEDEYRNKLFIRLMNNFTFSQLEHIEEWAKDQFDKNKNYKD